MPNGAIYQPPRQGLPYLVTVKDGEITSYTPVATKQQARDMVVAMNIGKPGSVVPFGNAEGDSE